MTYETGCQAGAHEPDPLTEGFMTIVIPDRSQAKSSLVSADGKQVVKGIEIKLGICSYCAAVYRVKKEDVDADSNNDV